MGVERGLVLGTPRLIKDMSKYIGYHEKHALPIKQGDTVTIPKGTVIRTTNPARPAGEDGRRIYRSGRTMKVKVNHILSGTGLPEGHPDRTVMTRNPYGITNPEVVWPGTGGYWNSADINDCPEVNKS